MSHAANRLLCMSIACLHVYIIINSFSSHSRLMYVNARDKEEKNERRIYFRKTESSAFEEILFLTFHKLKFNAFF